MTTNLNLDWYPHLPENSANCKVLYKENTHKIDETYHFISRCSQYRHEPWRIATYRPSGIGCRGVVYPFGVQFAVGVCGGGCYQTKAATHTT